MLSLTVVTFLYITFQISSSTTIWRKVLKINRGVATPSSPDDWYFSGSPTYASLATEETSSHISSPSFSWQSSNFRSRLIDEWKNNNLANVEAVKLGWCDNGNEEKFIIFDTTTTATWNTWLDPQYIISSSWSGDTTPSFGIDVTAYWPNWTDRYFGIWNEIISCLNDKAWFFISTANYCSGTFNEGNVSPQIFYSKGTTATTFTSSNEGQAMIMYLQLIVTPSPTKKPTPSPTKKPTSSPTKNPTPSPTQNPTPSPTQNPTPSPTKNPTLSPTQNPTASPSQNPTSSPTNNPSQNPTNDPSQNPSVSPMISTPSPSNNPSQNPTVLATNATHNPSPSSTEYYHTNNATYKDATVTAINEAEVGSNNVTLNENIMEPQVVLYNETFFLSLHYIAIIIAMILILIIICSWTDSKYIRTNDYHKTGLLVAVAIGILDLVSDIFFAIHVGSHPKYQWLSSSFFVILIICVLSLLIPRLYSLIQLHFELNKWQRNDELNAWISSNAKFLYTISIICGSAFTGVELCHSNLFNLDKFDIPLNKMEMLEFQNKRIWSAVLVENIPQLAMQIWLITLSPHDGNEIVYISILFSVLSLFISILSAMTYKNIVKSRDFGNIEFDITGQEVISNLRKCRNNTKKLRYQLSSMFGINGNLLEIKRPRQIQNGLRLSVNIYINNTKLIDLNCCKIVTNAKNSGELYRVIKETWNVNPTLITNIRYQQYESMDRRKNTVNIKHSMTDNTHIDRVISMSDMSQSPSSLNNAKSINQLFSNAIELNQIYNYQQTIDNNLNQHPFVPPVTVTDYGANNNVKQTSDNNLNQHPFVPPVVATDYGATNDDQHSEDSQSEHDQTTFDLNTPTATTCDQNLSDT